jgi:hypothetical protein
MTMPLERASTDELRALQLARLLPGHLTLRGRASRRRNENCNLSPKRETPDHVSFL